MLGKYLRRPDERGDSQAVSEMRRGEGAERVFAEDGSQGWIAVLLQIVRACFYVDHYKEHKQRIVVRNHARVKEVRLKHRRLIWNYVLAHPCVDCGESDPVVLEFDHVCGDKSGDISNLAGGEFSTSRLKLEIEKCEVRCANCHRRKTALQFGWSRPNDEPKGL